MYLWNLKVHLLATRILCTVEVTVTAWTCRTTVAIIAGEFCIDARGIIHPASSTIGFAIQSQYQGNVGEG